MGTSRVNTIVNLGLAKQFKYYAKLTTKQKNDIYKKL